MINEQLVLALSLFHPEIANESGLSESFFTSKKDRLIYRAAKSMNGDFDLTLLSEKLNGKVDSVYLSHLFDGVPRASAKHLPDYIAKIEAKRLGPKILQQLQDFQKTGHVDLEKSEALLKKLEYLKKNSYGGETPVFVSLADVEPRPIEWLWFNRFPLGKLSLIVGDPGLGKSFFSIYLAARVSQGECWPDIGAPTIPGSVIMLSAEDDLADTIRVRLDAAGADLSKIIALKGIKRHGKKEIDPFNVKNCEVLKKTADSFTDVRVIIIDPITSFMGDIEGNSNLAVRGSLAPLIEFAADRNIAVIAVSHLNKNTAVRAIYRTMGSLAFTAAARSVWAISKDKDDQTEERRIFTPLKSNLSIKPTSLAFRIKEGALEFEPDPIDIQVDDLLSQNETEDRTLVKDAEEWLKDMLSDGPVEVAQILKSGKENGFSERTVRRARNRLNISKQKFGYGAAGRWTWSLD